MEFFVQSEEPPVAVCRFLSEGETDVTVHDNFPRLQE